jgi:hemerythrin-like domain-containing protein
LRADHVRVKALLNNLQQATTEGRRTSLIDEIEAALREHTTIEEQIFYPAFREAAKTDKDRRLFHEAVEEHHVVDVVLPEVRDARHEGEVFTARAKVLRELVLHHIEEEQDEMFPRAHQLFSADELRDLGTRMNERKRADQQPTGTLEKVGAMIGLSQS